MLHCVITGLKNCVYIASDEANTGCKFEHMYHLKLNMLYSLKYTGWKYSLFRKSSEQDRRACHKPVSHRYHMSGRPLQTKLPKVYILWYIPKLLGMWKRLTHRITRPLHKKTVRWMSDNDISRIVERLRPSLPQILQNQSRGTMQQTILTNANRAYIICHNWSCSSFTVISWTKFRAKAQVHPSTSKKWQ